MVLVCHCEYSSLLTINCRLILSIVAWLLVCHLVKPTLSADTSIAFMALTLPITRPQDVRNRQRQLHGHVALGSHMGPCTQKVLGLTLC